MKSPTREFLGHTWVGWLNLILLRWFFIRLAWEDDDVLGEKKYIASDTDEDIIKTIIGEKYKKFPDINRGICSIQAIFYETKWKIIFRWPWIW